MSVLTKIAYRCVPCSLRVRNFDSLGFALSDCCRDIATTGVLFPDGRIMWRCPDHKGLRDIRTGELGPVVTEYVETGEAS